jgi:hypothetical protein
VLLLCLQGIQQMNHEQLLQRDGGDGSHGSFGLGGPMGLTGSIGLSHHSSGGISPSTVTPATTAGGVLDRVWDRVLELFRSAFGVGVVHTSLAHCCVGHLVH